MSVCNQIDVSIIIRTFNEAEYLGKTLNLLLQQHFSGQYEIIVVDSESTDCTQKIARKYGVKVLCIPRSEFTYGRSLNLGAENALGKFIVNLSAHAFPTTNDWLEHLTSGFHDARIAGVYGRQISDQTVNPLQAFQHKVFFGPDDLVFNKENEKALKNLHFSNSNCAIRRNVWERFRFDENVPYAEDTLWQRQIIESGYSVLYKADATVQHTHMPNPRNAFRNAKRCSHTLALIDRRPQTFYHILGDFLLFSALVPIAVARHTSYVWNHKCWNQMFLVPFMVISMLSGWLMGRLKYRISR